MPPGRPLWTLRDPGPTAAPVLPAGAARVVHAIRDGAVSGLLPPVAVAGPAATVMPAGELHGDSDARAVATALAEPRFAPLRQLLTRLDTWCAAKAGRYRDVVARDVLQVTNGPLFGPVVTETFLACATQPTEVAARQAHQRGVQYQAFLELFLDRLRADLGSGAWPSVASLRGPVTGLLANHGETHHGGQRVLRVDLAGGGRVAYKPRPASGEALFLAAGASLFALLDRLPPASGAIRLPLLRIWSGRSGSPGFAGYSWQEWVEPAAQRGVLAEAEGWSLTGTVLTTEQAHRFWHAVGALSAVCYAFGVVDMHGENLLVGAGRDGEPLMYPVDLESYFAQPVGLADTGLVESPAVVTGNHHPGIPVTARWCFPGGPPAYWSRTPDGLALYWRANEFGHTETRSEVADDAGRVGYGGYLPALLRGMFDAWTLLCRHRSYILGFLDERLRRHTVRVIARGTATYTSAMRQAAGLPGPGHPLLEAELAQMAELDVPYFFRSASGGPVLRLAPASAGFRPREVCDGGDLDPDWPPVPAISRGERLTLPTLGIALRDAAACVVDQAGRLGVAGSGHTAHGVDVRLEAPDRGQVAFDWVEQRRRITYRWSRSPSAPGHQTTRIRLRVDEIDRPL